jgi:exodeoxyribonuclease VII small subunit
VSDEQTFEQSQRELDEIVDKLERGDLPIDTAIALWSRGEKLYLRCVSLLDAAEGRIEELDRSAASQGE